tara:strand:- start:1301 stop:1681 length:381 start_codon:yes stop_codon:yes gene_type:complete
MTAPVGQAPTEKVPELEKPIQKKQSIWSKKERDTLKAKYGSEIIVENGSSEDVNIKQAPSDAYIIRYMYEDKVCLDLTRGTKVKLFDMYWDKFKGGLQSIGYGNGDIKPNLWGYQNPSPKKKKRKG